MHQWQGIWNKEWRRDPHLHFCKQLAVWSREIYYIIIPPPNFRVMPPLYINNSYLNLGQLLNSLFYFVKLTIFSYIKLLLNSLRLYNGLGTHMAVLHLLFIFKISLAILICLFLQLTLHIILSCSKISVASVSLGWHWK